MQEHYALNAQHAQNLVDRAHASLVDAFVEQIQETDIDIPF